ASFETCGPLVSVLPVGHGLQQHSLVHVILRKRALEHLCDGLLLRILGHTHTHTHTHTHSILTLLSAVCLTVVHISLLWDLTPCIFRIPQQNESSYCL